MGALCAASVAVLGSREGRDSVGGALGAAFTRGGAQGSGGGGGARVAGAVVAVLRLGGLGMSSAALGRKLGQPTPASLFRQLAQRDPPMAPSSAATSAPSSAPPPLLDLPPSCGQGSLRQALAAAVLALLLCRGGEEEHDAPEGSSDGGTDNASAAACLMLVLGLPTLSALTLCVVAAERAAGAGPAEAQPVREYVVAQLLAALEGSAGAGAEGHSPSPSPSPLGSPVKAAAAHADLGRLPLPAPAVMQLRALLLPLVGRDVTVTGRLSCVFWAHRGASIEKFAYSLTLSSLAPNTRTQTECVDQWAQAAGRAEREAAPAVEAMVAAASEREALRGSRGASNGPHGSFVV